MWKQPCERMKAYVEHEIEVWVNIALIQTSSLAQHFALWRFRHSLVYAPTEKVQNKYASSASSAHPIVSHDDIILGGGGSCMTMMMTRTWLHKAVSATPRSANKVTTSFFEHSFECGQTSNRTQFPEQFFVLQQQKI